MALTNKQKMFVKEYLIDLNATQAAIRAGYSEKTAGQIGEENLKKPEIASAVQAEMDKRAKRIEITQDSVMQELAKIGFGNIRNLYAEDGSLMHVQDMPESVTATIQEVTEETIGSGDNLMLRRKFKIADKKASLELCGKHLKLFTDKIEIEDVTQARSDDDITQRITELEARILGTT